MAEHSHTLYLDEYAKLERKTRRHDFKFISRWGRILTRQYKTLDNPEVVPDEFLSALRFFVSESLQFKFDGR